MRQLTDLWKTLTSPSTWERVVHEHAELPPGLYMPLLAVMTFIGVNVMGFALTLPPGPLCDEGMVLFMEGGCDWGLSNYYFFSKVGLLLVLNLAFFLCCRWRLQPLPAFVPHLLLLGGMAVGAPLFSPDSYRCETYYSHPNGSMAQMIVEAMAFAFLGMRLVPGLFGRSGAVQLVALVGWNGVHVALFYVWLLVTPHWTWLHTGLLAGSLLALAGALPGLLSGRRTAVA